MKVIHINKKKHRLGLFPTDWIPADSVYFTKLLEGVRLPVSGYKWIHRRGDDGVKMKFRIDSKRFVHVERNGVTALLYSEFTNYKSSNRKH